MSERISVESFDKSCQTREKLDESAVSDYAKHLADGGDLPAVVAYLDEGGTLYLSSGFHRVAAHERAGRELVLTEVRPGSRWDALAFGVADNSQHVGVRLSRADKRAAVERLLRERPDVSDSAIAKAAFVTNKTVARVRADLGVPKSELRRGADGRVIDTSNIGHPPVASQCGLTGGGAIRAGAAADGSNAEFSHSVQSGQPGLSKLDSAASSDSDCPCGGEWTSDGEGGRYCEGCGANHPETPSVPFEASSVASGMEAGPSVLSRALASQCGRRESPERVPELVREVTYHLGRAKYKADALHLVQPGPHREFIAALDAAGRRLDAWRQSA